jgi:predicted amidohydrolase
VVLANAGDEAGLIIADLSQERLSRVRTQVPVLDNRRYAVVPHAVKRRTAT